MFELEFKKKDPNKLRSLSLKLIFLKFHITNVETFLIYTLKIIRIIFSWQQPQDRERLRLV